ncbi:PfkB family carbohydrate kinase [Clostridium oryzae]|uniref:Pseudouridine kinase n=1 Tax=Clostridium oryzae TaxID=1450648 RepID=A0A1V4IR41_9CLOT|nr:PfkB family carbohydrate kinase [Clostridium oryzae]OPJ62406.1 pseudouridine kinase [Clostridium oryzae]
MTNREKEILKLIKDDPLISQQQLADILGITRSSVAVHITNLLKKGYIKGKGYIVTESPYITVIGGSNIDIQGFPNNKMIFKDSNPGKVKISLGGVGRNIAENIVRLGIDTKLISVIGSDIYGSKIIEDAKLIDLDVSQCMILEGFPTSTYLSMLDEKGDMITAVNQMDIFEKMDIPFIKKKKNIINNSKLCVIDTNLPKQVIEYIVTNFTNTKYFLDTVSSAKALKVKDIIGKFHTIKPNKIEAEMLSGIKISSLNDAWKASKYFLGQGVKRVFISLGDEGLFYNDGITQKHISNFKVNVINTTGAGDAFVAALSYCYCNDYDIDKTAVMAMAASVLALSHEDTINPSMSVENINKIIKELNLC